jgi:membrane protein YqaA with SNARE-associated domain
MSQRGMLARFYAWLIALAATRRAPLWLFLTAFAEASFFPPPPDLLLIPMILARPRRAWWLALVCTVGSVLGGLLGYWIGAALLEPVALPIVRFYHAQAAYQGFLAIYACWGFWAILIKGLTPIPFKLVTIAAGAAHLELGQFVVACIITRGGRFFLLEALPLRLLGERAREFIEYRLILVTSVIAVLAVVGVLAVLLVKHPAGISTACGV